MIDKRFDRRKLLGFAFLSSSTAALAQGPMSILGVLESSDGEGKVFAIVRKYFSIEPGSELVLESFYRSLKVAKSHHQDKAFLDRHLETKELEEQLEIYVIEEFALSTNYLHVLAGEEKVLRMRYGSPGLV